MVYVYIRFEYVSEQEEQEDHSEDPSEDLGLTLFFITGNPFFGGQIAWNQFSEPFWGSKVAEEPLPTSFKKNRPRNRILSTVARAKISDFSPKSGIPLFKHAVSQPREHYPGVLR